MPFTQASLNVNILYNQTIFETRKARSTILLTNLQFLFKCHQLSRWRPFSDPGHSVGFSCHVSLVSASDGSLVFTCLHVLDTLDRCRWPVVLHCDLSLDLSSCNSSAVVHFEQVPRGWNGVPSPVCHIRRHMTCLLAGDAHFGHLIKMMSAEFLLCQLTLFPSMINKDFVGEVLRRYVSILCVPHFGFSLAPTNWVAGPGLPVEC